MKHLIPVNLPQNSYEVHVEQGALGNIAELISDVVKGQRIAALSDATVLKIYQDTISNSYKNSKTQLDCIGFSANEANKNYASVEKLYTALLERKYERSDAIIAFGGGVAGDLAGFVAATYLRGVDFIQVPTTLLSMVDASVGGKVGYNNQFGKNLIGAFHQPRKVIIDPVVLKSLPQEEFVSGMAECVKHAMLLGDELFDWTESNAEKLSSGCLDTIAELVAKNVACKAQVVASDEREQGIRALLNFGHTFGHAIESVSGYGKWLHGQAVALGMVAATKAACLEGLCRPELLNKLEELLVAVGLPTHAPLPEIDALFEKMKLDKKVKAGRLRLILPREIGKIEIVDSLQDKTIKEAWSYICD